MISIIVPIYNGEKYIKRCVNSILNQSYKEFELILVDDGSKDSSLRICKELECKDSRIQVISQENQGPIMARRSGVINARGEFLTFLDADDTFCRKDVLKTIIETLNQTNAEVVQFGNYHTYFHGVIKRYNAKKWDVINGKEFNENAYIDLFGGEPKMITPTVWGKVYLTEKMKEALKNVNIRLNMGDDLYINNLYFEKYRPKLMINLEYAGIAHGIGIGISVGEAKRNWNDFVILKELQIEIINRNGLPENFLYHTFVELVYLLFYSAVQVFEESNSIQELQKFVSESFKLDVVKKSKKYLERTEYQKWKEIEDFYSLNVEEYCSIIIKYVETRTMVDKIKKLLEVFCIDDKILILSLEIGQKMNLIREFVYRLRGEYTTEKLIKMGMKVGKNFGRLNGVILDPSHCWLIEIGDNVTLAPRVHILCHDASTKQFLNYTKIGRVVIGNNVFIGAESVVLPNVKIGNNVIIGANSTVTRDIPDNVVAAGNPARVISTLEEYLKRHRENMKQAVIYNEDYTLRGNLTEEKKQQMIADLQHGMGYID